MHVKSKDARNAELSAFLRAKREAIRPEEAGLPPHGPRSRAKGLRREEVAQLAGIGLTWYTMLETGRDLGVSAAVLSNIARVLRLTDYETRHLFTLTGLANAPAANDIAQADRLLQRTIDGFTAGPAFIVSPHFDLLAYNRLAAAVYGYDEWAPDDRNILWHLYTDPERRVLHEDWEGDAYIATSLFRSNYGRRLEDPRFAELISRLSEASAQFRRYWAEPHVLPFIRMNVTLRHRTFGLLCFEQQSLLIPERDDTHARLHVPKSGTDCAKKLERLLK
jgi:transcriptional regulator with XRE-family HTH domain